MPMSLMAVEGGPTKMTPSFWHCSANSTFSDRNPYPGWIASAPEHKIDKKCWELFQYLCPWQHWGWCLPWGKTVGREEGQSSLLRLPLQRASSFCRCNQMFFCCVQKKFVHLSASLYTATVRIPSFLAVFITLQAISPLLAIRTWKECTKSMFMSERIQPCLWGWLTNSAAEGSTTSGSHKGAEDMSSKNEMSSQHVCFSPWRLTASSERPYPPLCNLKQLWIDQFNSSNFRFLDSHGPQVTVDSVPVYGG